MTCEAEEAPPLYAIRGTGETYGEGFGRADEVNERHALLASFAEPAAKEGVE